MRNNERFKNFYKERLKGRTIFGEVVRRKEAATFSTEDGVRQLLVHKRRPGCY